MAYISYAFKIDPKVVDHLLDCGVNVNHEDKECGTALTEATWNKATI